MGYSSWLVIYDLFASRTNLNGMIAGRTVCPFGKSILGLEFQRDRFFAGWTISISMVWHGFHFIGGHSHDGSGNKKARHEDPVGEYNWYRPNGREPTKTQACKCAFGQLTLVKFEGEQSSFGCAVIIVTPKLNACFYRVWHLNYLLMLSCRNFSR